MLLTSALLTTINAGIVSDLKEFCPNIIVDGVNTVSPGYWSWGATGASASDWYWGNDWSEFLANGTEKDGSTVSAPPAGGIHPAGFSLYTLAQYQEPPICMFIPGSRNKKVEILMESDLDNANLCITDASYKGVATNDVGNVKVCGSGKIYACFTAASGTEDTDENFGFYVSCEEGCEDSELDVWIRIRISNADWDTGKTGVADDLEHWCEAERGTNIDPDDLTSPKYYTYPSDLVPENPSEFPFHIVQIPGGNAGGRSGPHLLLLSVLALVGLTYLLA